MVWALAVLGRLHGRSDWQHAAAAIVRRHAQFAAAEPALDLISGRAGFLAGSLAAAKMVGDAELIRILEPCAQSLCAVAAESLPEAAEAGLAHGRAGIGLSLARWAACQNDTAGFDSAFILMEADLSEAAAARRGNMTPIIEHDGRAMIAWCRGGIGVALAAIRLGRPLLPETRDLVETIADRLEADDGAALCFCHGALGLLEFSEAARDCGIEGAGALDERLRGEILARLLDGEFCADHYHRIEAPGLMRGLAGTGWALLRMLDPLRFPSALTLEAV